VRRHRLVFLTLSALLLGALTPALAQAQPPSHAHGKGPAKPDAHDNGRADKPAAKPVKPPKPAKARHLSGGGMTLLNAEFNVQAKADKLAKGHFHYSTADGLLQVKCKGIKSFTETAPQTVTVTADCVVKRESLNAKPVRSNATLTATFVDKGEAATTPDEANISVTDANGPVVTDNGPITGDIHIK
jgi:hypothetical protein